MSSWSADGRTAPGWRRCSHVTHNGRCTGCNARDVGDYTQTAHSSMGGVPVGFMEPPNVPGMAGANAMPKGSFVTNLAKRR